MSHMDDIERRHEQAQAHIRATIMNEFCDMLNKTGLSPMALMRLAAKAVGSVYREVADAHSGPNPCPCGWCPHEGDVEVLGMALMTACEQRRAHDLQQMRIAGSA